MKGPLSFSGATSLYIHFPLCRIKCSYCAFNITTSNDRLGWRNAFVENVVKSFRAQQPHPVPLSTVFFGGGTPSLATREELSSILRSLPLAEGAEVTVEVNPTLDKNGVSLSELCELGATRLSLGVQSLDDRVLKHMLREHSGRAGLAALEQAALRMGPDGVSADVIVGLPPSWKERKNLNKDLETLAAFADHISVYELTIEPGTKLERSVTAQETKLPCSEQRADEWVLVKETLECLGFERYEVSNFARNGRRSRHNEAVWRGSMYAGVGPGAHARLATKDGKVFELVETMSPHEWSLKQGGTCSELSQIDRARERVLMAMRTADGLSLAEFEELKEVIQEDSLPPLVGAGFLALKKDGGLRPTSKGMDVLDSVIPRMLK